VALVAEHAALAEHHALAGVHVVASRLGGAAVISAMYLVM
jgi:hypothetical protein